MCHAHLQCLPTNDSRQFESERDVMRWCGVRHWQACTLWLRSGTPIGAVTFPFSQFTLMMKRTNVCMCACMHVSMYLCCTCRGALCNIHVHTCTCPNTCFVHIRDNLSMFVPQNTPYPSFPVFPHLHTTHSFLSSFVNLL